MPKIKSNYVCQNCGYKNPKWLGRCPECSEYNTLVEELDQEVKSRYEFSGQPAQAMPITEVTATHHERVKTKDDELDRVFGGGVVPGSVVLIGGDPGIGKSTLILQLSSRFAQEGYKVLYCSAEESAFQLKLRADRLGISSQNLIVLAETNFDVIRINIEQIKPDFLVIDSIQMIYRPELSSAPGTISQVRESATEVTYLAKKNSMTAFIIGHVTKEGSIAGPKTLEHIVDAVFYFEGDRFQSYRVLKGVKNRFGSTNEVGIFEMLSSGLKQVTNPSELFMSQDRKGRVGSVIVPSVVGTRTILVEVQSLTSRSGIGIPSRRVSGVDFNRVAMILAVLERKCGLHLGAQDVFVNAVGGVEIQEPATDLGIALAIASSFRNKSIDQMLLAAGEVGLVGEVRGVTQLNARVLEGKRLGFTKAIVPKDNLRSIERSDIDIVGVSNIRDALEVAGVF